VSYDRLKYTRHAYEGAEALNDILASAMHSWQRESLLSSSILSGPTFPRDGRKLERNERSRRPCISRIIGATSNKLYPAFRLKGCAFPREIEIRSNAVCIRLCGY